VSRTGNLDDYGNIFAEMNAMPSVALKAKTGGPAVRLNAKGTGSCTVVLENPTDEIAFFIRLRTEGEAKTWTTNFDDNFFSLLPRETKTVRVKIKAGDTKTASKAVKLVISGWNCPALTLEIPTVR
jgi:hypothetical protein